MSLTVSGRIHMLKYRMPVSWDLARGDASSSGMFCRSIGSYTRFQSLCSFFYCRSSVSLERRPLPPILAAGHPLAVSQLLWDLEVCCRCLLGWPLLVMLVSSASWPLPVLSTVPCRLPPSVGDPSWQWVLAGALGARFHAPAFESVTTATEEKRHQYRDRLNSKCKDV